MTALTAVPEHVHRDKNDQDQHPKPVGDEPCHGSSPSVCRRASAALFNDDIGDETQLRRLLFVAVVRPNASFV
jgi:hypothetical protein